MPIISRTMFGKQFLKNLDTASIFGQLVNRDFEGEAKLGSTVSIPTAADATVDDYDRTNGANNPATAISTSYVDLLINKDKYTREIVDNYEAATVPADIKANRIDRMAVAVAKTIDLDIIAEIVAGGTQTGITEAITEANVYDIITVMTEQADNNGLPQSMRNLVVKPAVFTKIKKSSDFIKNSDLAQNMLMTGQVGMIDGWKIFISADLPVNIDFVGMHEMGITSAIGFQVEPAVADIPAGTGLIGATEIHSRVAYGTKVGIPEAVYYHKNA